MLKAKQFHQEEFFVYFQRPTSATMKIFLNFLPKRKFLGKTSCLIDKSDFYSNDDATKRSFPIKAFKRCDRTRECSSTHKTGTTKRQKMVPLQYIQCMVVHYNLVLLRALVVKPGRGQNMTP